jgi:DNA modification methylase
MYQLLVGDVREQLRTLPDRSVHCVVTSPPYFGLRDYGHAGQIGLEASPNDYVAKMVEVFREVKRVLRDDGTLWLNLGDSYAGAGYANHKINGQEWYDGRQSRQADDPSADVEDSVPQ